MPLYGMTLEEFKPEKLNYCFKVTTPLKSLILQAKDELEMHTWLNTCLKHKLIIEDSINNISFD